jgi:enterochelin esterase family protein
LRSPRTAGDRATFLWRGSAPAQLIGDFNNWGIEEAPLDLEPLGGDLWARTLQLPPDAYIEYAYLHGGARVPDPLNPQRTGDGMGHTNSYLWMPDARDTPLARRQPGVPRGTVTRHEVAGQGYVVGASRTVYLYEPPGAGPHPLLAVFDGRGYLRRAHLATIVDNLAAQQRIRPPAMALIQPGGRGRTVEYACSDTTVAFIIRCVLPVARAHLNLLDVAQAPGAYGIMGASMGGLMAFYTAFRAPEIFGSVLCESGAFGADQLYYRSVLEDLIRCGPVLPLKIWMDVGLHEWFLAPNRRMQALLRERGYDVHYTEQTSGHNYPSWRNVLWQGLEYLYGQGGQDRK